MWEGERRRTRRWRRRRAPAETSFDGTAATGPQACLCPLAPSQSGNCGGIMISFIIQRQKSVIIRLKSKAVSSREIGRLRAPNGFPCALRAHLALSSYIHQYLRLSPFPTRSHPGMAPIVPPAAGQPPQWRQFAFYESADEPAERLPEPFAVRPSPRPDPTPKRLPACLASQGC